MATPSRLALLLAAPVMLALMGAAAPSTYTRDRTITSTANDYVHVNLQLIEMGGCQYVVALPNDYRAGVSIVHHAACTNPAHTAAKGSTP